MCEFHGYRFHIEVGVFFSRDQTELVLYCECDIQYLLSDNTLRYSLAALEIERFSIQAQYYYTNMIGQTRHTDP